MWKNFINLKTNLLQCSKYFLEQQRTTYILKRKNGIRLNKLIYCLPKRIKIREYDYELVEDLHNKKRPDLDLVLLKDIPGLGMTGEKIKADFYASYFHLLLPKLAVYENSPEAQSILRKKRDINYTSIYSQNIEKFFFKCFLSVFLNSDTEWTLQPFHIRVALRQIGIITHDNCIELPDKKISGPNPDLENKAFIARVVMNKVERFPVKCKICHVGKIIKQNLIEGNNDSDIELLFEDQREEFIQLQEKEKEIKREKDEPGYSYVHIMAKKLKGKIK